MIILGISAYYHDSAAAIILNGEVVAAAQEERFSRKKNDKSFPSISCQFCLDKVGLSLNQIDAIVFYEKPFLKFERLLESHFVNVPFGFRSFLASMPEWISNKIYFRRILLKEFQKIDSKTSKSLIEKLYFSEHHLSHASSAYFSSTFDKSAILTIDGVGEWATTSIFIAHGNKMKVIKEMHFPDSIGLLYSSFTYFLGFKVNSGEYKLMGLAPYGSPNDSETKNFIQRIKENLLEIHKDGSITLNMRYFSFTRNLYMIPVKRWERIFQMKKRLPEAKITQRHCNLAFAIQAILEEIIILLAIETKEITKCKNICLAGGVALNCVANGKLLESGLFEKVFVQPASGDSGGAIGAALAYSFFNSNTIYPKKIFTPFLGPQYSNQEVIEASMSSSQLYLKEFEDEEDLFEVVSNYLIKGKIIGWFQGKMEFGPRALGNRSILADSRHPYVQYYINKKIKRRESFRPFAPSVLEEEYRDYFELKTVSNYMLYTAQIKEDLKKDLPSDFMEMSLTDRLNIVKSDFPAITHVDFSARIQTVKKELNPKFHGLLKRFSIKTGTGMLLNTSFNVRGEPIVCSPIDAFNCFLSTDMDYLVINNLLYSKNENNS